MKTHTSPQRRAIRLTGISLLIAILTAGGVLNAQEPPPKAVEVKPTAETQPPGATPAPATPPKAQAVGDEPAPALRITERNSMPAKEPPSATAEVSPSPGRPVTVVRRNTKSTIPLEKDANDPSRTVVRTLLDEEVSSNPQEAARNYEAVIAAFDSQRENAAQAIFRLGETYRKLGRLEEARVQYARILREFVDYPDLARLSQKQLSQNPPNAQGGGTKTTAEESVPSSAARATAASAEDRKLLHEEISLLQRQLEETHELVKSGVAPTSSVYPIQREILQLKRQLLRYENGTEPVPARNSEAPGSSNTNPARSTAPTPAKR